MKLRRTILALAALLLSVSYAVSASASQSVTVRYEPSSGTNGYIADVPFTYAFRDCLGELHIGIARQKASASSYRFKGKDYAPSEVGKAAFDAVSVGLVTLYADVYEEGANLGRMKMYNVVTGQGAGCYGQTYRPSALGVNVNDKAAIKQLSKYSLRNLSVEASTVDSAVENELLRKLRDAEPAEPEAPKEKVTKERQPDVTVGTSAADKRLEAARVEHARREEERKLRQQKRTLEDGRKTEAERAFQKESRSKVDAAVAQSKKQRAERAERVRQRKEKTKALADDLVKIASTSPKSADTVATVMVVGASGLIAYGALTGSEVGQLLMAGGTGIGFGIVSLVGTMGQLFGDDNLNYSPSAQEWLLGSKGPFAWAGDVVSIQFGTGLGLNSVNLEKASEPLESAAITSVTSEMIFRAVWFRLAMRGGINWGSLETASESHSHRAYTWEFAPGVQLFSGGLFSPWAEYRFQGYPECWDATEENEGRGTEDCPIWMGESGRLHRRVAFGNTFGFRPASGNRSRGGYLRNTYLDVGVAFGGPLGTTTSLTMGVQFCLVQCSISR